MQAGKSQARTGAAPLWLAAGPGPPHSQIRAIFSRVLYTIAPGVARKGGECRKTRGYTQKFWEFFVGFAGPFLRLREVFIDKTGS